jgi:hypothetical protein
MQPASGEVQNGLTSCLSFPAISMPLTITLLARHVQKGPFWHEPLRGCLVLDSMWPHFCAQPFE